MKHFELMGLVKTSQTSLRTNFCLEYHRELLYLQLCVLLHEQCHLFLSSKNFNVAWFPGNSSWSSISVKHNNEKIQVLLFIRVFQHTIVTLKLFIGGERHLSIQLLGFIFIFILNYLLHERYKHYWERYEFLYPSLYVSTFNHSSIFGQRFLQTLTQQKLTQISATVVRNISTEKKMQIY